MSGVTRSSTVASTTVPLRLPPQTTTAPLPTASAISASMRSAGWQLDQRAEHDVAARIAGRQLRGLVGELADEGVGDLLVDDDALGRHADLALVHEGAEGGGVDRAVEVGVVEHDQRRLAAELEQHRLEMLSRQAPPTIRPTRVEPVKLIRLTAGWAISASTICGASAGALVTTLTTPLGKPASAEHLADQPVRRRGTSPTP